MLHLVTILLCVYLHSMHGHVGNEWSYEGDIGPSYWSLNFPHCAGLRQSPVRILTNDAVVDSEWLLPFHMRGCDSPSKMQMRLENKGYTVEVDIQGEPSSITGGGLTDVYIAEQFHFHWGKMDQRGSEHAIDGKYFPMEVGRHKNHLDDLVNHLLKVPYRGNHTMLETFSFRHLLPRTLDTYCRYYGSLTTPPCYESVNWFIFYETIEISEQQLNAFRHIYQNFANQTTRGISDDFRPTQPLNLRVVSCSKNVQTGRNQRAEMESPTIHFGQQHLPPWHLRRY